VIDFAGGGFGKMKGGLMEKGTALRAASNGTVLRTERNTAPAPLVNLTCSVLARAVEHTNSTSLTI